VTWVIKKIDGNFSVMNEAQRHEEASEMEM
jgi:hypothetical protein